MVAPATPLPPNRVSVHMMTPLTSPTSCLFIPPHPASRLVWAPGDGCHLSCHSLLNKAPVQIVPCTLLLTPPLTW